MQDEGSREASCANQAQRLDSSEEGAEEKAGKVS